MKYLIFILLPFCARSQVFHATKFGFGYYIDTTAIPVDPPDTTLPATVYGTFVFPSIETPNMAARIARALDMGVELFRVTHVQGGAYGVDEVVGAGLLAELTYNANQPNVGNGYVTDTTAMKIALTATLNSVTEKPSYICVRNEPLGHQWDTSHPERYVNELNAACTVGEAFGIPVFDGGFTNNIYNLWKYYSTTGNDSLQWLIQKTGITNINSAGVQSSIYWNEVVITGIRDGKASGFNQHGYEPYRVRFGDTTSHVPSEVMGVLIRYMKMRTGKRFVTNEFGTRNSDPGLVFLTCDAIKAEQPIFMEYFAGGDGTGGAGAVDNWEYYKAWLAQ